MSSLACMSQRVDPTPQHGLAMKNWHNDYLKEIALRKEAAKEADYAQRVQL